MKNRLILLFLVAIVLYFARKVFYFKPFPKNDTLLIGTNAEFPPFSYYHDSTLTGFDIELIEEVAARLHKKIIIKDLPFETLIPEIQLNKLQVLVGGFNPTPERSEKVFFTKPVFDQDQLALFTRSDADPVTNLASLEGKRVIVNEGYFADAFLSEQPILMTLIRLSTNSTLEALTALDMNKGDVFVASINTVIPFLSAERKAFYQIHPIPQAVEKDAFVVSKKYPDLLEQINKVLDTMTIDGTLDRLKSKWFSHD